MLVDVGHLRLLLLFLDVVIVGAVYPLNFQQRLLILVYGEIDHFYYEISLQWKSSKITHRLRIILKLDDELVVLETLNNLLHHRNMIRAAIVVLLADIQRVINKIQLNHPRVADLLGTTLVIFLNRK